MLELSKKILEKVSFDQVLFYKELKKALSWITSKEEIQKLKDWCLREFGQSHPLVLQRVFVEI
ncbi:MAG: hypothetical protein K0R65_998 [Crocinitomicaceae bacterium]|jgi:hypothetical protein|nr:hypothetical protein [Crocinitomicaceae bacterium]